jgi:hypothetical protein
MRQQAAVKQIEHESLWAACRQYLSVPVCTGDMIWAMKHYEMLPPDLRPEDVPQIAVARCGASKAMNIVLPIVQDGPPTCT